MSDHLTNGMDAAPEQSITPLSEQIRDNDIQPLKNSNWERIRRLTQFAIVGFEMSPLNEAVRYSAFGATLATTNNTLAAATVLGVSTLALESSAAIAGAPILDSDIANRWTSKLSDKYTEKNIDPSLLVSPVAQAGIALYGGSLVSMMVNKAKNPTVTKEKNRSFGLKVSSALGLVCMGEGIMVAEGIAHPNLATIGAATVAVGGLVAVGRWTKNKLVTESNSDRIDDENKVESFEPKYNLSTQELRILEQEMVSVAREREASADIVALWISPTHRFSNFLRTHEASYFPEVADVSEDDEKNTLFLALIDTREGVERVVHGVTVMRPLSMDSVSEGGTGFYTIDSLIKRGNFSSDEFHEFYGEKGADISKCLSVETNFRIGERPPMLNGLKMADIAYVAIFQKLMASRLNLNEGLIFATVNSKQIDSFTRVGLRHEPIMGRTDLDTEESELGIESQPVTLLYDAYARDLFSNIGDVVSPIDIG